MDVHVPLLPPCLYLYFIPHFNILAFNTFYRRSRSPNQNPIPVSSSTSSTIDIAMDVPRRSQRYSRYLCSHRSPTSIDDRIEHAWPSNNYRPKKEAVVDRPRPDGQKKPEKPDVPGRMIQERNKRLWWRADERSFGRSPSRVWYW